MGKVIVFCAPSGSGKSTIIGYLIRSGLRLSFSISATSRPPRGTEQDGVEYYFLTQEDFRRRIERGDFLEHCEVYEGRYYGTLKSEVDRMIAGGENVICDVDVIGAENIKKIYGDRALCIFVQPPSIEELRRRLEGRGTDSPEVIDDRIARAEFEMSFADRFDCVIVNDVLEDAQKQAYDIVSRFIGE